MSQQQTSSRLALIIPAAGSSTRMGGDVRKPLIEINGLPVICHTMRRFQGLRGLEQIIIVVHNLDLQTIKSDYWLQLKEFGATTLIAGGKRRQDSVACGVDALHPGVDLVLIHDAVRPFVPRESIEQAVAAAAQYGAAVVGMPVADTVKRAQGDGTTEAVVTTETVPRGDLWAAQTPQVFRRDLLHQAFLAAHRDGFECTDDAQLVERIGTQVRLVRGSYENFKITTPEHLHMAQALLELGR
jgi:2-C-methyl-D-erythritol 4-phosphate cytidylyltransferase